MNTKNGNYGGLIIGGGIIGAVIGVIAALILIKSSEQADVIPQLNKKKGIQLGLGVVSLLKSLSIITRG